ncbi:MAG: bifunctional (p)ppGpp synthetase/guanosine-3',5'-bis(diphosphate) 3'-pyrophosphohydrolase [Bacteroidales bacterium]|nr:bifunctional (p)ppGpp synthetase/guanosine-3',5'-bis(diphosphate) 3'-pyrophosphohydrolase [Bacteroidales bacterium]
MEEKNDVMVVDEYKEKLFQEFISSLPRGFQSEEILNQLRAVYDFAYKAHYGVRRKGGNHDPYITHPVAVATITANEIGLGVSAVIAALLHDVVEDTEYTSEDIKNRYGESIANIVDGLTKITNVYDAKQNVQAATFKKMLLGIPHDPRVAFVKIADRLHNMRTIEDMPDGTRQIKAGENLYVYVPIAYQLGLFDIKNELEDLSFKYVHPERYQAIAERVEETAKSRDELMSRFKLSLMRVLVKTGKTCRLSVVSKSLYQTSSLMTDKNTKFEEINYQSVRIVFDPDTTDSDAIIQSHYQIYASVISNFHEKSNSRRDYVIMPKNNGFCALVFKVMFNGIFMEVQILTADNDIVAHRGYSPSHANRQGLESLRNNLTNFDPDEDAVDLLNRFRSLSNVDNIFVFTPKGQIVELPKDSTVLDFAFAIHEKMGQHCLGATMANKTVSINHVLKTTDQISVLTSPSVKPNPQWIGYVKSDKARQWLESFFKRNADNLRLEAVRGEQEFHRVMHSNRMLPEVAIINRLLQHFRLHKAEELYRKIARGEISSDNLIETVKRIKAILEDIKLKPKNDDVHPTPPIKKLIVELDYKKPFLITNDIPYILSTCCSPIPGDDALCCVDNEGMVVVHRRDCEQAQKLTALYGKQTTKVLWGEDLEPVTVSINVQGLDRNGILKDITSLLSDNDISVQGINMNEYDTMFGGTITIIINTTAQLESIISKFAVIPNIVRVNRIIHMHA